MTGTEGSSVLGGRRKVKARSKRVAVEHSKPVQQPLGMTDHRESNDAWMVPVGLTSRLIGDVDVVTRKDQGPICRGGLGGLNPQRIFGPSQSTSI